MTKFQPDLRNARVPVPTPEYREKRHQSDSPLKYGGGAEEVSVAVSHELVVSPPRAKEVIQPGQEDVQEWEGYNNAVGDRLGGLTESQEGQSGGGSESGDDELESEEEVRALAKVEKKGKEVTKVVKDKSKAVVKKTSGSGIGPAGRTLAVLGMMFAVLAWAHQYQQESARFGYCDTNKETNSIIRTKQDHLLRAANCVADRSTLIRESPLQSGEPIPHCEWEQELPMLPFLPTPEACTACPSHAICDAGRIIGCQGDYILEPHLLDSLSPILNGLPGFGPVAFPPTCELDVKTKHRIGQIAKAVEAELAKTRGERVCYGGKRVGSEVEKFGEEEGVLRRKYAAKVSWMVIVGDVSNVS